VANGGMSPPSQEQSEVAHVSRLKQAMLCCVAGAEQLLLSSRYVSFFQKGRNNSAKQVDEVSRLRRYLLAIGTWIYADGG
jgi:hypothetical protein